MLCGLPRSLATFSKLSDRGFRGKWSRTGDNGWKTAPRWAWARARMRGGWNMTGRRRRSRLESETTLAAGVGKAMCRQSNGPRCLTGFSGCAFQRLRGGREEGRRGKIEDVTEQVNSPFRTTGRVSAGGRTVLCSWDPGRTNSVGQAAESEAGWCGEGGAGATSSAASRSCTRQQDFVVQYVILGLPTACPLPSLLGLPARQAAACTQYLRVAQSH